MDEWAFLSLAKGKADVARRDGAESKVKAPRVSQPGRALSKIDAALALDYEIAEQNRNFRGVVSLAAAALVNLAFFGGIELTALNARTPSGEVIVAELDGGSHERTTASLQ